MPRLLEADNTVAVLLGAHDWTRAGLTRAPSFQRSARLLHSYLVSPPPFGLGLAPYCILNLFDDPSPASAQLSRIATTVGSLVRERHDTETPIRDVLIYYIGHGNVEAGRPFHFLVSDTQQNIENQTSISAYDLAHILRTCAPSQRRIGIFDCCFSEAAADAFGAMGSLNSAVAATLGVQLSDNVPSPERGVLLLCSSPRGQTSIGPPSAQTTLFTGALLSVLREGNSGLPSNHFSFADLHELVYDRMLREFTGTTPRPALHQPDQREGDLTRLPAFPNRGAQGPSANVREIERQPKDSTHRRFKESGREHLASRSYTAAIEDLREALEIDPTDVETQTIFQEATARQEEERRGKVIEQIVGEIQDALSRNKTDRALQLINRSLERLPAEAALLRLKADTERKLQEELAQREKAAKARADRVRREAAREEEECIQREQTARAEAERIDREAAAATEAELVKRKELAIATAERLRRETAAAAEAERIARGNAAMAIAERLRREDAAEEAAEALPNKAVRTAPERARKPRDTRKDWSKEAWLLAGLATASPIIGYLGGLIYIGVITHLPMAIEKTLNLPPLTSSILYVVEILVCSFFFAAWAAQINDSFFTNMWYESPNLDEWVWHVLGSILCFVGFSFGCRQFLFTANKFFLPPAGMPLWLYCCCEFVAIICFHLAI